METSLKLGRVAPVRVVTIFAAAAKSEDDKRLVAACLYFKPLIRTELQTKHNYKMRRTPN